MRSIITVAGKDKPGIIAEVSKFLSEKNINIVDISQTIMDEFFAMIMLVDLKNANCELAVAAKEIKELGDKIGMTIHMQHEDVFNTMHNI